MRDTHLAIELRSLHEALALAMISRLSLTTGCIALQTDL